MNFYDLELDIARPYLLPNNLGKAEETPNSPTFQTLPQSEHQRLKVWDCEESNAIESLPLLCALLGFELRSTYNQWD